MKGINMIFAKTGFLLVVMAMGMSLFSPALYGAEPQGQVKGSGKGVPAVSGPGEQASFSPMPGPGKKVPIADGRYFIYGFDKKPKMGPLIMKVQIFTAEGKKETSAQVKADSGMPSMKGAHETGDRGFVLSKKGDYLLPINIVMPGDWEIRLTILQNGKVIFRGRYNFDV